jgi:hypothetical protein
VKDQFEPELTFSARLLLTLTLPLSQLSNAISISSFMHCFHCILTSLTSQALLQAVLDKEPSDFIGSVSQYEISSSPGYCVGNKSPEEAIPIVSTPEEAIRDERL